MKQAAQKYLIAATLWAPSLQAGELALNPSYHTPDGAVMTYPQDHSVIEPYFPTKALLLAHNEGMNITETGTRWVEWLITRQHALGLFFRLCLNKDSRDYDACGEADADDAMMAMWIDLLYRLAPQDGMPEHWKDSAERAEIQLDGLYDYDQNIYMISQQLPVGLFMDNIEIYAALKRAAKESRRLGMRQQAAAFASKALRLQSGIIATFWDAPAGRFRASTQPENTKSFYPSAVAQLYPMLHEFHFRSLPTAKQTYKTWMTEHRHTWLCAIGDDFPWGLVAVASVRNHDMETANCWYQHAAPYRHSNRWNILDEVAFQAVEKKLHKQWPDGFPACAKGCL